MACIDCNRHYEFDVSRSQEARAIKHIEECEDEKSREDPVHKAG